MNPNPPEGARVISFSIGKAWIDENNFCYIRYTPGGHLQMGIDEVIEMSEAVFDLCGGKLHKHLVDTRGVHSPVIPGAREELRNNGKLNACRSAAAMITDNMANKMMINFFIRFNKPKYPYRAFEDAEQAVNWLKSV